MKDFWSRPSRARARAVFKPDPAARSTLERLRRSGCALVVLSRHDEHLLPRILDEFALADCFDDVVINGDKGRRAVSWLARHGIPRDRALMVGDREDLDIGPMVRVGIRAVLVDRPYNRHVDAPRLDSLAQVVDWVAETVT